MKKNSQVFKDNLDALFSDLGSTTASILGKNNLMITAMKKSPATFKTVQDFLEALKLKFPDVGPSHFASIAGNSRLFNIFTKSPGRLHKLPSKQK